MTALILPILAALALCVYFGFAWATLALPQSLASLRWLLMPLLGLALLLDAVALLTTTTALAAPQCVLGLAVLALPFNVWAAIRLRRAAPQAEWLPLLLALPTLLLALLPPLQWGAALPIGNNWDGADFYVPLGRALQLVSQRDLPTLPRNPLTTVFSIPPVSGRIHAFSYLHAAASSMAGREPLATYPAIMAFVLALQPLAAYALGRVVGLGRWAALLGGALVALAWLPLWVAYNNFSNHVTALPLIPLALATTLVAVRDGGWRALATAGLALSGLATAYYPAVSAYVAFAGLPLLVFLLRPPSPVRRRDAVLRVLGLGALAALFSGAAQWYFFGRDGFLGEVLRAGAGYQIGSYVSLADALGVQATFRGETVATPPWLLWPALAAAAVLVGAAIWARQVPLLVGAAVGALAYQVATMARDYYYGFYKGMTFAVPLLALLLAAGAAALWDGKKRGGRQGLGLFVMPCAALLVLLNLATVWRLGAHYAALGPQLWSAADADVAQIRAEAAPGDTVLVVPTDARSPVFNSLISYALLGHKLYGNFSTAYNAINAKPGKDAPDLALLPELADPASYGYQPDEVRWAGAGMRLYGREPGVYTHRAFGGGGRFPQLAPGDEVALQIGTNGIALPGEPPPDVAPSTGRVVLALASFAPAAVTLGDGPAQTLPGGVVEIPGAALALPGTLLLRNTGAVPVFLWWGEVRDSASKAATRPRDDVAIQVLPRPESAGPQVAADLVFHTEQLPDGPQKLTALLTLSRGAGDEWQETGRWVFFPNGKAPLNLLVDLTQSTASLAANGAPADIYGSAPPADDGRYRMALLIANDAQIVYATTLWQWRIRDGTAQEISADSVQFDVVPLPRPATPRNATTADGNLRLLGVTQPRQTVRPGEEIWVFPVWQSLRRIGGDLQASVVLRVGNADVATSQPAPLGRAEHGTSTWQEGERSEQDLLLRIPDDVPAGDAILLVQLRGPDGQIVPFAGGQPAAVLGPVVLSR